MDHSNLPSLFAVAILLMFVAVPVTAGLLTVSSISPEVGYTNGKSVTVTITGTNFSTTEGDIWLEKSGEDDLDAKIVSWTDTTIVGKIKISTAEKTGDWAVVVAQADGETEGKKTGAFTIVDKISLTSITPESGPANDDDVDFTLAGTGLGDIEEVYLYNNDYDENITAGDVDALSSIKVKGTFDLEDMDEDTYDVCVVDTYGTIECDLSFEITSGETGSLEVSSSPSGATILIDGSASGTTPDTIDDILEGSHKVVLQKSGYEDWGKMVTVEADETVEVDANLVAVTMVATTIPTPVPTTEKTPLPTTERTPEKTTVPTTSATTTTKSPLDPVIVLGAAGLGVGLVMLRRR
jgi:PEGA domain/IPT/TIG domain